MHNGIIFITTILATLNLIGAEIMGERGSDIRLVPVEATPEPDGIDTVLVFPEEGEVKESNPVSVQIRLEGYPIGYDTDYPRSREIRNGSDGQSLHLLIDDKPFIAINEAVDDTADTEEIDFDQTIQIKLPYTLKKGIHIIRAFPVRSYGECLKGPGCFASSYFYLGSKVGSQKYDLSKPYLTYNEPQGDFDQKKPILLDFFITNTQLSKDGYKVRLTIDGSDKRIITQWIPYYIYGMKKGSHTIKLELLDPNDKVLPSLFNDTEKRIVVR